jgi:hypothetical protein
MQLVLKVEVTRGQHLPIYRCQTASQVSLFIGFLISWISLPTKTTKIGTPQIKVISQYIYLSTNKLKKNLHDGHILLWQGINCQSSAVNFLHDPLLPLLFNIDKCPGLAHLTTSYQMCTPPYIHFCIHTSSYNIISHIYIYLSFICISIKTYSNRPTPV